MMDYPLTVPYLLDRAARYFPGVEVVSRRPDRSIARSSYAEVRSRAHQLAGGLARLGVDRGDRVASLGWNHVRHLEAYFGVPLMGGILHTLNPRLPAEDLAYVINHAGDSVLLVEWISSVDLENALMGHPAVAEAAVIAAKHPKWDERPVAVVVLKKGASATAEELRGFLEPKFAKFWLPDEFVFTTQVQRTSVGKFQKTTLRDQYGGILLEHPKPEDPCQGSPPSPG